MSGAKLIAAERRRQVEAEGWTAEHDADHTEDEIAIAAACYAMPEDTRMDFGLEEWWPWAWRHWKPGDRVRELVKAGALIAAEIDRLQARAALRVGGEQPRQDPGDEQGSSSDGSGGDA